MSNPSPPRDPRPLPPDPSACCGSGCDPCILDVYYEELAAWEERQRQRQQQNAQGAQADTER
ncbi:MAG: oxidoreductase [Xanthomonadaceae bacterium]|nr:oxidoreductase [Xanthomonadaceae bacterium]